MDKYIIRKFVTAKSAMEAIKQDKKTPVHEVWIDNESNKSEEKTPCIGFSINKEDND